MKTVLSKELEKVKLFHPTSLDSFEWNVTLIEIIRRGWGNADGENDTFLADQGMSLWGWGDCDLIQAKPQESFHIKPLEIIFSYYRALTKGSEEIKDVFPPHHCGYQWCYHYHIYHWLLLVCHIVVLLLSNTYTLQPQFLFLVPRSWMPSICSSLLLETLLYIKYGISSNNRG